MVTKAYCMINVDERFCPNGYQDILRDLVTIPELESIERVEGIYDLLVKVKTPVGARPVADEMGVKTWVKSLRFLKIEPAELSETVELTVPKHLKAQTHLPY